jgi:hypothetical protein
MNCHSTSTMATDERHKCGQQQEGNSPAQCSKTPPASADSTEVTAMVERTLSIKPEWRAVTDLEKHGES